MPGIKIEAGRLGCDGGQQAAYFRVPEADVVRATDKGARERYAIALLKLRMSLPPKDQTAPDALRATPRRSPNTQERGVLDLSRRNLSSIKREIAAGTSVDAEVVRKLEQAILDLEADYKHEGNS
jgi:hypothetical protein